MDDLTRLLIERACERLCIDYVRRLDAGEAGFADLFTEDAAVILVNVELNGRDEIAAFIRRRAQEARVTRHLCSNIAIDVIGETEARGMTDMTYFTANTPDGLARRPSLSPAGIGSYEDLYRRTAQGWRIAKRRFRPVFLREAGKQPPRDDAR